MALHLLALKDAADRNDVKIWRVIFDNNFQKSLLKVSPQLKTQISFSTKRPWVRHDEHYHVDFVVHCENN